MADLDHPMTIEADGVRALVSRVGAGLLTLRVGGVVYVDPQRPGPTDGVRARVLLGPGRGDRELDPAAVWDVAAHDGTSVTLTCPFDPETGDGPLSVTAAYTVGSYGLAVICGITPHGDGPAAVGLTVAVHPCVGDPAAPPTSLQLSADHVVGNHDGTGDGTGALPLPDPVLDPGRDLETVVGGGVPPPGKTHVSHVVRAADGDGVTVWADPPFSFARVRTGADGLCVAPMTCLPGRPDTAAVVAAHHTWVVSWGVQPFPCRVTATA